MKERERERDGGGGIFCDLVYLFLGLGGVYN